MLLENRGRVCAGTLDWGQERMGWRGTGGEMYREREGEFLDANTDP